MNSIDYFDVSYNFLYYVLDINFNFLLAFSYGYSLVMTTVYKTGGSP